MDIKEVLGIGIDDWINASPNKRSLRMLERFSGVPYTTLRRIHAKECAPSLENVIPLCDTIFPREKTNALIEEFYPKLLGLFSHSMISPETKQLPEDLKSYLLSKMHYLVFTKCLTTGTTEEKLLKLWGQKALEALDDLVSTGEVIKDSSGKYTTKSSNYSVTGSAYSLTHLKAFLDEYNPKHEQKENVALTALHVHNVSLEDQKKLFSLQEKFNREVSEILKNSDPNGSIAWFSGNFCNVIELS
ncbi:MAG: hypothetical protein ACOH5I_26100 [Oligoflexus sp.]